MAANPEPRVAAAIMAAGRATRFGAGAGSKVVAEIDGEPLVRRVARSALASRAVSVLVVTGHASVAVRGAIADLPVTVAHNPDFAEGMASSIKMALSAVPSDVDGLLILLADMPFVRTSTLDAVILDFAKGDYDAVVPRFEGRVGNPVLLGRNLFREMALLDGDTGARKILSQPGRRVWTCDVLDAGIVLDIDTPDALRSVSER